MSTASTDRVRQCLVELTHEERWLRIALSLAGPYTGGSLVSLAANAHFAVEATDEDSAAYQRSNWLSGVMSGARYAFRLLDVPRRHIHLTELSGKIGSADMGVLANAAVIAVARLSGKDVPQLGLAGWALATAEVSGQTSEHAPDKEAVA